MSIFRTALFSSCLMACAAASGQQMYKTIGPDGKVTFSDRPKLETATHLSVMRSNLLRPVATPGAPDAEKPASEAVAAAAAAAPAVPPTSVIAPQIEAAILQVMAQAEFSRRHYRFCNATQASARAFNQAASGWKHRNYLVLEQQRKLLMQMVSPAKRYELQGKMAAMLEEETAKVSARNHEERAQWCKEAITAMANKEADLSQPEMMAVVVQAYKK